MNIKKRYARDGTIVSPKYHVLIESLYNRIHFLLNKAEKRRKIRYIGK